MTPRLVPGTRGIRLRKRNLRIPSSSLLVITALATGRPDGLVPLGLPYKTRVEECQAENRNGNHGRLEDHKGDFVVGEFAIESLRQLRTSEDRSDDDNQCRETECVKGCLEVWLCAQSVEFHVEV